ncbi:MAG: hypothetical protein ACO1PI_04495 [Bacteroidota bacterium]
MEEPIQEKIEGYNLSQTKNNLSGGTPEQIVYFNQWASIGFDRYHDNSTTEIDILIDGEQRRIKLSWDSNFSKATMREDKDIAHFGGVAMAWFVMSVLLDYKHVEQTEIGSGVDYCFMKREPNDDDLNFLGEFHYIEVSGILEEKKTNTLDNRVKNKHNQISKGSNREMPSSVIVTLFSTPKTVKELHQ